MPPPGDQHPDQGEQHDRRTGRLQVHVTGHYPRREQSGTHQHTDEALHQLALVVHTRIAEAHETPELRILPIKRLLDLL